MQLADKWTEYSLIDAGDGEKLEKWGDIILTRPDPQAIWPRQKENSLWYNADACYHRSKKGGGYWENKKIFRRDGKYHIKISGSLLSPPDLSIQVFSRNRRLTGTG
jgi:23S rRNA (cytosine1962-C5)-methyltransferase